MFRLFTSIGGGLAASLLSCTLLFGAAVSLAAEPPRLVWTELRTAVLRDNLELRLGEQQIEAARADLQRAGLRPNPTLSLGDSGWKGQQSPIGRAGDLVARIDQTLERGDKRALREQQGQAFLQAAQFDLQRQQRQILTRLAGSLIDLDTARRRLSAAQDIAAALERADAIARRRLSAGDLSEIGAGRVSTDAIRARNDLSVARGDIAEALQAIRGLVSPALFDRIQAGEVDVESLPGPADGPLGDTDESSGAPSIGRAPELAGARRREEAARAALALATAQRTRDITVGVQLERQSFSQGAAVGVFASIPLLLFNDYSADIRRASSDLMAAQLDTERQSLQLAVERRRLAQSLLNAREREARLRDEALPMALRSAQTAEYSFQRGAASVLDVLDAQRTLRGIQIEVIAARADRLRAASSLALLEQSLAPVAAAPSSLADVRP